MSFEKWTNMARTVIEVYPLLGIQDTRVDRGNDQVP
jgi:hypothetical protein